MAVKLNIDGQVVETNRIILNDNGNNNELTAAYLNVSGENFNIIDVSTPDDPGGPVDPTPLPGEFPTKFPGYVNTSLIGSSTELTSSATAADINNALASFRRVVLPGGTYNMGSTPLVGSDNVLEGKDGELVVLEFDSGFVPIQFINTHNEVWKNISCSGASNGSTVIAGLSSTAALTAGRHVLINSQDIFNPKRGAYHTTGEWIKIKSKTSSSITLEEPLILSYSNTPRIRYRTTPMPENIGLKNLTIKINGIGSAIKSVVTLQGALNAFVYNCRVLGDVNEKAVRGITFDNCIQTQCYDTECSNVTHEHDKGPYDSRQGYPIYHYSCGKSYVWNCYGTRGKHFVDSDMRQNESVQMDLFVYNCVAENQLLNAFSTHGGTFRSEWVDCTVTDSWGGWLLRQGKGNTTVKRCRFLVNKLPLPLPYATVSRDYWINSFPGYGVAIMWGEPIGYGGIGDKHDGFDAHNALVEDFEVFAPRVSNGVNNKSLSNIFNVYVHAKNFTVRNTDQSLKLVATNMTGWSTSAGNAILLQGNSIESTRFEVLGFDLNNQPAGRYLLYAINATKTGITLDRITVDNAALPGQPVGGTSTGSANVTEVNYI